MRFVFLFIFLTILLCVIAFGNIRLIIDLLSMIADSLLTHGSFILFLTAYSYIRRHSARWKSFLNVTFFKSLIRLELGKHPGIATLISAFS